MTQAVKIALAGALGRMGKALAASATDREDVVVTARFDRPGVQGGGLVGRDEALAAGQVVAIVIGWGVLQHPRLIAPEHTIESAAAPAATLRLLVPVLAIGGAIVLPSLYWLLRVFKSRPTE